jgi:hypothetical protein
MDLKGRAKEKKEIGSEIAKDHNNKKIKNRSWRRWKTN